MSDSDETSGLQLDIDEKILEEEINRVYDELFADVLSAAEFRQTTDALCEDFVSGESEVLVEGAEGLDAGAWVRGLKLGWLGKLAMGGLAALGTGIAALITAGKDRLAMIKLKKYMNRLVEVIDQGIQKKRSIFTVIMPKSWSKWRGERNMACFRTIQEMADRQVATGVMSAAHKLGYFGQGQMMNIASGSAPQSGGGLDDFRDNVLSQLTVIVGEKPVRDPNKKRKPVSQQQKP